MSKDLKENHQNQAEVKVVILYLLLIKNHIVVQIVEKVYIEMGFNDIRNIIKTVLKH